MVSASNVGIISNRHDVVVRDQDILSLYLFGYSRKKIAQMKSMTYHAVVKVVRKMARQKPYSR